MIRLVLVINSGSSSIKFCFYRSENKTLHRLYKGRIEKIGTATQFIVENQDGIESTKLSDINNHYAALSYLIEWLQDTLDKDYDLIIGHRVVHGGTEFKSAVRITPTVLAQLQKLIPLAPLHQSNNLAAIQAFMELDGALPQVACFDTAFHTNHTKPVNQYALPEEYYKEGIRRYGFHGLSYEFISSELKKTETKLYKGKVVVAHLGNGSSLCALNEGASVDSSMGFSALDGLMMGTRCGSIDATIPLYLLQEKKMDAQKITELLYQKSGLLGVSGKSNDMHDLINDASDSAKEAIKLFVYRIVRETGGLISILQGIDGLVFTGGIGENEAEVRQMICDGLAWSGLDIDAHANQFSQRVISTKESKVKVCVIPTDEELMIAQHTLQTV